MLNDIILSQKRELTVKSRKRYVERQIDVELGDNDLIRVILGPRRCGKSTLAIRLAGAEGSYGYVNFDDERLIGLNDNDGLIAAIEAVYDRPKTLLLDEIQNLEGWELLVNRLQRQGFRLYITGSNAHLLSSELATHLTGRHIPIVLFPFSFEEILSTIESEITQSERVEALRAYVEGGGMPEPVLQNVDRTGYLRTLWDSIIYKDIVKRHRIRSIAGIEDLAGYLLANVAAEYSHNRLTEVTQVRSVHTVQKYLDHLREAFLFFSVRRYSVKYREQVRANRKIYCIDNGYITSRGFRFVEKTGALFENAVAVALHRRSLQGAGELYYWRGDRDEEVDFVVKEGAAVTRLIQVCWDMSRVETRNREIRSLVQASKVLSCDDLVVVTAETEGEEQVEWYGVTRKIRLVPMFAWTP